MDIKPRNHGSTRGRPEPQIITLLLILLTGLAAGLPSSRGAPPVFVVPPDVGEMAELLLHPHHTAPANTTQTNIDPKALGRTVGQIFGPLYTISMLKNGEFNLLYCTGSFHHKNNRWPKDYPELSAFVQQSEGYLILGDYAHVDFTALPDDGFKVCFIPKGSTNAVIITLGDSPKEP